MIASTNWTELLTVLTVGLLIALALQILLFCLGSALAVSLLRFQLVKPDQTRLSDPPSSLFKMSGSMMGTISGLGLMITVNSVLFMASFLATTLPHFGDPVTGAIAGIVLWAAYLILVLWLCLTTVSSFAEGFLNIITIGLRRGISTALRLFWHPIDEQQLIREQMTTEIREEVQLAFNALEHNLMTRALQAEQSAARLQPSILETQAPTSEITHLTNELQPINTIWRSLTDYLTQTSAKKLTPKQLDRTLTKLFADLTMPQSAPELSSLVDWERLMAVLKQRQDLSEKKQQRIIRQIQAAWGAILSTSPTVAAATDPTRAQSFTPEAARSEAGHPEPTSSPNASALHAAITALSQQVLSQIPTLLQPSESNWSSLAEAFSRANLEAAIAPITASLNSDEVKQQLEQLLVQAQAGWVNLPQDIEAQTEQFLTQAEQIRQRVVAQVAALQQSIQQGAQMRLQLIQQDVQNRLDTTRRTLSAVAWWLFATLLTSGASAALAGAIASGFDPRPFLP